MNKQLLKSYIVRYDKTQSALADAMGISLQTLNAKINKNRTEFNIMEKCFIKNRYSLSDDEYQEIFFINEVS